MAPEIINKKPYDLKVDIWCLGVLLFELLMGFPPFRGKSNEEKCANIKKNQRIELDHSISNEAFELINSILKTNQNDRLSMQ